MLRPALSCRQKIKVTVWKMTLRDLAKSTPLVSALEDQHWNQIFWFPAFSISSKSKNLPLIFFSDLLNFISKLNSDYSAVSTALSWVSLDCMALLSPLAVTVIAEQPPVLGLTYLPFVDDNRKARTKSRSSQNTSSVRCFPLVANLLLRTGSKEFSKVFGLRDYPPTLVRRMGLRLDVLSQDPSQRFHTKSLLCG